MVTGPTHVCTKRAYSILELGDCLVGFGTCFVRFPELMVAASQAGTVPVALTLQTTQLQWQRIQSPVLETDTFDSLTAPNWALLYTR